MSIATKKIRDVIDLAKESSFSYDRYWEKYFPNGMAFGENEHKESPEYIEYEKKSKALENYVLALDFSDILDLEAVMLIGRGDEINFSECRKFLGSMYPEKEKYLTVDYLIAKLPLGEYLEKGLKKVQ